MEWMHYSGGFFAGMFLANTVPHFVQGILGNKFPTPFAKPPGRGLSSPLVNIIWALFNLCAGYLLFRYAQISDSDNLSLLVFFAGIACMSIPLSIWFAGKHNE